MNFVKLQRLMSETYREDGGGVGETIQEDKKITISGRRNARRPMYDGGTR